MVFLANQRWLFYLALVFAVVFSGQIREREPETIIITSIVPLPVQEVVSPTPSPTAAPALSFGEMNRLYGPCVVSPVIMYHHVEPAAEAIEKKHQGLSIDSEVFKKQMTYLRDKGYHSITPEELAAFFDSGTALPQKPFMITFDDGYDDNGKYAFEILKEVGFKAVIFLPTGLMQNRGYLTWQKVMEMNWSGTVTFGNHTWSHMNASRDAELVKKEIGTANIQLGERGLNGIKTFAYPYGEQNGYTKEFLREMEYKLGFTTKYGKILCKEMRLTLPRVRVNGSDLVYYGF